MSYSSSRYTVRKNLPDDSSAIKIPYPNEIEAPVPKPRKGHEVKAGIPDFSSIVNYLKNNITIEEIILVGLIILLLGEEIKDEFLIIMLVYILLF